MLAWLVAVVLFFLGSIAVSQYAQGRVQRGDSRFAHLLFAPRLVIYVGMFVLGLRLSIVSPIVGIPFTLGALIPGRRLDTRRDGGRSRCPCRGS